jgi:hypothetical protein
MGPYSKYVMSKSYATKGFMGQTTFDSPIKSNVLIMEAVNLMAKHVIFTVKRERNVYFFLRTWRIFSIRLGIVQF